MFQDLIPLFSNNIELVKDRDFLNHIEPVVIDGIDVGKFCIHFDANSPIKYHLILRMGRVSDRSGGEMVFDMTEGTIDIIKVSDKNCYKITTNIALLSKPMIDVGSILDKNIPTGNFMIDPRTNHILLNLSSTYDPREHRRIWNFSKNEEVILPLKHIIAKTAIISIGEPKEETLCFRLIDSPSE